MSVAKYPEVDEHLIAHGEIFVKLSHMTLLIENDDPDTEGIILQFLHKWFCGHVMNLDKKFVEFIASQSIAD